MQRNSPGSTGVASITLAAVNAIGLLISSLYSLHLRDKFAEIFSTMGHNALPVITRVMLGIHWSLWLLILMILLAALIAKEFIRKKWIPLVLNVLFLLLTGAYWLIFRTAMYVPLFQFGGGIS